MSEKWSRRRILKQFAVASAVLAVPTQKIFQILCKQPRSTELELQIFSVSANTIRLSILPVKNGKTVGVTYCGALVREAWGTLVARLNKGQKGQVVQAGKLRIQASLEPIVDRDLKRRGATIQTLSVDRTTGVVSFATGEFSAPWARGRWPSIRSARGSRPDGQRTGRLQT